MRFPLLSKAVALGAVIVALLVALGQVAGVVSERRMRQVEAQRGLADSLAGDQAVLGPVLQMQCTESWQRIEGTGKDRKTIAENQSHLVTRWPRVLSVDADAAIEPRHRGLFKLNGYLLKHTVAAQWDAQAEPQPSAEHAGARMQCQRPTIAVAISDARGIRSAAIRIGDAALPVEPGSLLASQGHGFHAVVPAGISVEAPFSAQLSLELAGTRSISWAPIAQDTQVRLGSRWPHPSFGGRFSPVESSITAQGFKARWNISALATTAQAAAQAGGGLCDFGEDAAAAAAAAVSYAAANNAQSRLPCVDTFGVGFIDPVNAYVLSDRAVKYGLLFIALTFVAVGLVEVLRRLRVHPIQYLLVGSALTVFFLLLLSLSEHLPFWQAYLAGSAACTALLAYYGSHVLRSAKAGLAFGAGLGLLYAALYALLQMEQAALVLGSVLLFVVLAAVMVATRRVDWYALTAQIRSDARPAAAAQASRPASQAAGRQN